MHRQRKRRKFYSFAREMKIEGLFCHSHKPFFCTETFVNTAKGQQNRHYFPILCIFTQILVNLTNIPRFSLWPWAGYFICSRKSSWKKSRFLKHFCFCALCLTIGAVPLLRLSRNRESENVKVLYFVGSDQKCGTKFSACRAHWWPKKKEKTVLPR